MASSREVGSNDDHVIASVEEAADDAGAAAGATVDDL